MTTPITPETRVRLREVAEAMTNPAAGYFTKEAWARDCDPDTILALITALDEAEKRAEAAEKRAEAAINAAKTLTARIKVWEKRAGARAVGELREENERLTAQAKELSLRVAELEAQAFDARCERDERD